MSAELLAQLQLKAAPLRSIQVCAALDKILELAVEHVSTRTQFGRPLSKFQAIQHLVADIAAEAALARAATEAALAAAVRSDWAAANLGFAEHRLHEYTRAALAWRSEFGSVQHWDQEVTAAALAAGGDGLWSLIAD